MRLLTIIFFCLPFSANSQLTIDGVYRGKNIYVQNPTIETFVFCTDSVIVNGAKVHHENASAYEVHLDKSDLQKGDSVQIKIYHKESCSPKILNPESVKPKPTLADSATVIRWTKTNKPSKNVKLIEQSGARFCTYGQKFRNDSIQSALDSTIIKQEMRFKNERYFYQKENDRIMFSANTSLELFDSFGNSLAKTQGNTMDLSHLKKGTYYLNFDYKCVKIVKLK